MAELLSALPSRRPEPTQADLEHAAAQLKAVGSEHVGTIYSFNKAMGVGYLTESSSGQTFTLMRKLLGERFDALGAGCEVRFMANADRSVVVVKIA
jgi:hypothetical protein